MSTRLAVLLTCHNRRQITLEALGRVSEQRLQKGIEITAFLVDDGSSDGTASAVCERFPKVRLLKGDGSLYWGGGMRRAFGEALSEDFDYYLWLNDDSLLDADAIGRLIATHREVSEGGKKASIVVGSFCDPNTGKLTYGGVVRSSRIHPLKFFLVLPSDAAQPCDTLNGNAVLIPRDAARIVGNISADFTHNMGDFDYGLRASKCGCSLWVAPGYVGTCCGHDASGTYLDQRLPLLHRMRNIASKKGLPAREYLRYARAHGGIFWPVLGLLPYVRIVLDSLLVGAKRKLEAIL